MARSIGLAMGVLLDAFVVRMLLIPAVMHLVDKGAWWLKQSVRFAYFGAVARSWAPH